MKFEVVIEDDMVQVMGEDGTQLGSFNLMLNQKRGHKSGRHNLLHENVGRQICEALKIPDAK